MLDRNQTELVREAALRCMEIETSVISALSSSINASFIEAVASIYNCKGRVVVTGIGKSAIIAQKIVATLNSTGTPSLFMHAADAIHGDLGMIRREDVVVCISKSGETPEIKALIPFIKSMGSCLIGMVANIDSSLGLHANHVLFTPVSREAEPNNLAPTSSTTAQIVMGDALAVALLALRGFTPEDFAQVHPGGSLGKQLYLKVSDIYPLHGKPQVFWNAGLKEVILEMTSKRLGVTAVMNEKSELLGIITDGDLRRMLQQETRLDQIQAHHIMSKSPKTIGSTALAVEAFKLMKENNITQLLVVDEHIYKGVVHVHDLIKEGIF